MQIHRYFTAAALIALMALPAAAQTTSHSSPAARSPAATAPGGQTRTATGAQQRSEQQIDINSASSAELDKLPGIGAARAQAIIANRPYRSKDELAQRKIVPQNVYNQIKDRIVARQSTRRPASGSSSSSATGVPTTPRSPK